MEPADSIRRLGFTRWYERRLIVGHAWFLGGFLCVIVTAASVGELASRGSVTRFLFYAILAAGAATIGAFGLHRYMRILVETLRLGERATCVNCGTYARFMLISASEVRCRRCEHTWRLIRPDPRA